MTNLFSGQCSECPPAPLLASCINERESNEDQEIYYDCVGFEGEASCTFHDDDNDCGGCDEKCSICLLGLPSTGSELYSLPCSHQFHTHCMAELHRSDCLQVCPLCRAPLPSVARDLFDKAVKQYCVMEDRVNRGDTSWSCLTKEDNEQLAEIVALWRESANRGVKEAWYNFGLMCWYGRGTKQHLPLAVSCFLEAAKSNQREAQNNLGFIYEQQESNYSDALLLYYKAARRGHKTAAHNFANMVRRRGITRTSYTWGCFMANVEALHGLYLDDRDDRRRFSLSVDSLFDKCLPGSTQLSDQILKVTTVTS
mmetsp:Transcript_20339/g.34319  ORF Transcript_20339/g.34319 Transcript_20339/m.34319 type:complete len:311 (+) Transcript_20339:186-1118(+)